MSGTPWLCHNISFCYWRAPSDVSRRNAGLLPQFKNLVSLSLNLNNCCAEAVNKLVSSITHKTLEELGLYGIILTPVTAAALGRSISEMSSLRELSISGPERGFLETNEIEASPTGFDRTSLVSQLFTFNTGGCRFLPSLHTLRLEHLNLNERGLRELLDNWKFFSELRYSSLHGNPLGDKRTVHSMVKKALPRVHLFSSIITFIPRLKDTDVCTDRRNDCLKYHVCHLHCLTSWNVNCNNRQWNLSPATC